MAFRQDNHIAHKQFVKLHGEELLQLGFSNQTLEYRAWTYLLEHGNGVIQHYALEPPVT